MDKKLDKFIDLIPDYINNRLSEDEAARFEEALRESQELEQELREAIQIKKAFEALEKEVEPASEKIFERISQEIGLEETRVDGQFLAKEPSKDCEPGFWDRLREFFQMPQLAWAMCAAQAVVLFLALLYFQGMHSGFETMTSNNPVNNGVEYNVIFKGETKINDLVSFLRKHHMKIVDGPTGKDLFVVHVPKRESAKILRESGLVEFLAPAY
ncbi:MAG: hypothetical protein GXO58_07290 [Thermodesulfobacteria bacterium]|nr:hypothetical protein [Thermodesulfobacteriota bacterium]